MNDNDEYDIDVMYALTWTGPEGHPTLYWSLRKGWTYESDKAWLISQAELDCIEDDEGLQDKLPQHNERKDGAKWMPLYRRFISEEMYS